MKESDINGAECSRKVESERRVAGAIRSLVKARSLQPQRAGVLHERLLIPILMHGSETGEGEI